MKVIDKLVTEWAYRCKKGYPDMNNPDDLKILKEIYSEYGIVEAGKQSQSDDDYVHVPGAEEHIYVRVQDFDTATKKPKPGAQLYQYQKKDKGRGPAASYQPIRQDAQEKQEDEISNEDEYVKGILTQARVPDNVIQATLANPNYKKAASIPDFVQNKDTYIKAFANLYSYKVLRGGLGELIPLVAIQGAKIGGANEKDITAGGKVLEIKELPSGTGTREFALASTAGIAGTKFQEHLETFRKAIQPFKTLPRFRVVDAGLVDVNKVPKEYLLALEKLLADFPYTEDSIDNQSKEIKIGDKKYVVTKGTQYTIQLDDEGNLVQTENTPKEAEQVHSDTRKLLNHPWVKSSEQTSPLKDLNAIKVAYLNSVDYLMLWTSPTSAEIVNAKEQAKLKDSESAVKINRVALGNLTLAYSTKK
jgi:hypothetical protein